MQINNHPRRLTTIIWNSCFSLSLFIVVLGLCWFLLAKLNFGYDWIYKPFGIKQNIETYAPQNRYKNHFSDTSDEERKRLFSEIVHSIQNQGENLSLIRYTTSDDRFSDLLLRTEEVQHLQDVANIVSIFHGVIYASGIFLIVLMSLQHFFKIPLLSFKQMGGLWSLFIITTALVILIIGPTKVFYQFHIWVFPADHEWFFYYQDSLMTTLMKAPDLFGYITIGWLSITFILFLASYAFIKSKRII